MVPWRDGSRNGVVSKGLGRAVVEVVTHAGLDVAEAVAAEVLAAVPAGNNDEVVLEVFAFEHPKDYHTSTAFAVVVFFWSPVEDCRPGVVCRAREFLVFLQGFERSVDIGA